MPEDEIELVFEFISLLVEADEKQMHECLHIMRVEAQRIGLDLAPHLERLGIARA